MIHQISEMREQVCGGLPQISNGIARNCDFPGTQDAQAGLQADRPAPFRTLRVARLTPEFLPLPQNYLNHWGVNNLRLPCFRRTNRKSRFSKIKRGMSRNRLAGAGAGGGGAAHVFGDTARGYEFGKVATSTRKTYEANWRMWVSWRSWVGKACWL